VALHVSLVGRNDLTGEIYRQLRAAIREGRLRPGDRLPPSRELAGSLDVARMTVTVAYERLAGEGYLTARVGAGTFVAAKFLPVAVRVGRRATAGGLRHRRIWDELSAAPALSQPTFGRTARFDFRSGAVDASLFPSDIWRRLLRRELRAETIGSGTYGAPAGHAGLRAAIVRQLALSRGVQSSAGDVTVTNGTQQALDLVARVLLEPGDRVAVESPGYAPARLLFASLGLRIEGVPVDAEGVVVDAIPTDARLVYVTPSHQYPLGVAMSLQRRIALSDWANRHKAAIIEDDYDSEFRFRDRPIEPLRTLNAAQVVYVGSFSKTTLPTLRLGFVLTPPSLTAAVRAAKFVADWHAPLPLQSAMARFLDDGHFARHVRRMRAVYQARHELLTNILARDFPEFRVIPTVAGLHVSAVTDLSERRLDDTVARASKAGVAVQALSRFRVSRETIPKGLVFGYGAISVDRIEEGLKLVRRCFEQSR
jgi:GntR family transcriptional regulator / MocR family aminotransferase